MCYNNYNFMDLHGNYMVAQERIDDAFSQLLFAGQPLRMVLELV